MLQRLQFLLMSHFKSLILTSSPAFSSYSYHSSSCKSIAVNLVPDSRPVASQSPYFMSNQRGSYDIELISYLRSILDKFKPSAIKLKHFLPFGRRRLLICYWCRLNCGGWFSLLHDQYVIWLDNICLRTLHDLQRHTKLASPLLPLISLVSCSKN